jgi:hypothetical protein
MAIKIYCGTKSLHPLDSAVVYSSSQSLQHNVAPKLSEILSQTRLSLERLGVIGIHITCEKHVYQ